MPIIVSRVAPQTPADLCIPRLNEGDQVLYINGRDVSQHTHEQVRPVDGTTVDISIDVVVIAICKTTNGIV